MNIGKNIDYSELFKSIDAVMASALPQTALYHEIGRLIAGRPEKGAAVAAAEYLKSAYPDETGFSPRNVRRMRDFYRAYEGDTAASKAALELGWTQNVVILEADLTPEERTWYIRAVKRFGWTKKELSEETAAHACGKIALDREPAACYTESENSAQETVHEEDTVRMPGEHLPQPNGGVCVEGYGKESGRRGRIPDRLRGDHRFQPGQAGISGGTTQAGRARHRLRREICPADEQRRLCGIRPFDRDGSCEPRRYAVDLRRRSGAQDAPPDGFHRPPPYYTGDFEETWQDVEEGCRGLLKCLSNDNTILTGESRP